MKKLIILLLSLFICLNKVEALSASSYIVMDTESNDVIMGKDIHSQHLIASTTKIMTCIIAIEKGNLEEKITVTKDIHKAVGSSIYLEVGEEITLKDLLYGMMLRSGNDAATMIAIAISGDMQSFSKLMNKKAADLKMYDTVFYNSHGLEEESGIGNKSTSYDMALLTSYAMQNKTFRKIFGTASYNCKSSTKSYSWQNKNKLLKYDYVTGGKTGYTQKAKRTLVTTGSIDNKNVVVVTLNDPNDWKDHLDLYKIIKEDYVYQKLIDKNYFKIKDDTLYTKSKLYVNDDYGKIVKNDEQDKFLIKYYLKKNKTFHNKEKVGFVEVYFQDKVIYSEDIYINIHKENFFTRILKWFKSLWT